MGSYKLMYTRVFFARHGAVLLWHPLVVLAARGYRSSQKQLQQPLQQLEHKHSRPRRGRRRPQRIRAVSWQRRDGADQGGRPHPRCPARRNAAVYGNLRRTSANAAPSSPPSPSGGQCRGTSSHTPASAAHAIASWQVRCSAHGGGEAHTGFTGPRLWHLHVPRVAAGRIAVERERQQDLRAVAFAPRVNPHARGRLGQLPRRSAANVRSGAARRGCECHPSVPTKPSKPLQAAPAVAGGSPG